MTTQTVVALSGGTGGAKLALGLHRILPADSLSLIVNTGDDFDHLGLRICPDIDTVLYTLAGLAHPILGWGRRDETWNIMRVLESLQGDSRLKLGDADLALHVERTRRLAAGEPLSTVTASMAKHLDVRARVLPMSDDTVRTRIQTPAGELSFQDYFVRQRCEPAVRGLRFHGAEVAHLVEAAEVALCADDLEAIVIAPSNPYLSIDPMLAIPQLRAMLRESQVPVIAVSPIMAGAAVKGPATKIMRELGLSPSALTAGSHYADLIDGFVLDVRDRELAASFPMPVHVVDTLMKTLEDRERVARAVLEFASRLRHGELRQVGT